MLPKRWIVERTIAWLNRCRRLAKDWENLNREALAFLRLASIRLMLENFAIPLHVPDRLLDRRIIACWRATSPRIERDHFFWQRLGARENGSQRVGDRH